MLYQNYARRAQRHVVDLPCTIIGPLWDEPVSYQSSDMSAHGMWVRTSFPLKRGEHVVVQFRPPAAKGTPLGGSPNELSVFARVARVEHPDAAPFDWRSRGGMGLEFCHLEREEERSLQRGLRKVQVLQRGKPNR